MRQGRASRDGSYGRKVEPSANGINPGWVGQVGNLQGNHITDRRTSTDYTGEKRDAGRGYKAPRNVDQSTGKSGSQGRY